MARLQCEIDPFAIHIRRLQMRFRRRLGLMGKPPLIASLPMRGWALRSQEFGRIVETACQTGELRSALEASYGGNFLPR